jgi:NADH-quinone oxidoreductase subunit G
MPKFVVDGKEINFNPGQTVLEAARENGISIPHFCWHPKLSVSGNCRVCLVEVEKMPKLVISCATVAAEGMVVHTKSPRVISARNAVMEFILINHPLDCPICDEAGECKLQDYTYKHSLGESRFIEEKVHKEKRVELGPHVMFDGERCISCSRCIRFCDEIAKEPQLTFVQRGDKVTIETYPGKQLDNPYSLNVTDICPVGALTNRDFRFKARVWEMSSTNSVCQGCARGCNMDIWVRNNEILRLTPRKNETVNSYWMCDYGRLNTFKSVNENRIDSPYVIQNGSLNRSDWDTATAETIKCLKSVNKEQVAFVGSPYSTCEDNYILMKFARSVVGTKNVSFFKYFDENFGDEILRRSDITPNSTGTELIGMKSMLGYSKLIDDINAGRIKGLYISDDDILAKEPALADIFKKLKFLIVHSSNMNAIASAADVVFPSSTYAEKNGTMVNFNGRIQRIRPAVATSEIDRALDGMSLSRLDKFGTKFDKWANGLKRDSRSVWKIVSVLAAQMNNKFKYQTAEDVFDEISKTIPEFSGLDYEVIGNSGVQLKMKDAAPAEKSFTEIK